MREIPNHPGYFVTEDGRVFSEWTKGCRPRRSVVHELHPWPVHSGHMVVALGRGRNRFVHLLVLTAFVGPCPTGLETLHRDGNPRNNLLSNLRYGTRLENVADARRHGTLAKPHARITLEQARSIRVQRSAGARLAELATSFGLTVSSVCDIVKGRTWKEAA